MVCKRKKIGLFKQALGACKIFRVGMNPRIVDPLLPVCLET